MKTIKTIALPETRRKHAHKQQGYFATTQPTTIKQSNKNEIIGLSAVLRMSNDPSDDATYEKRWEEFGNNVEEFVRGIVFKMPDEELLATSVQDALVSKVKKRLNGQFLHESLEVEVREIIDHVVNIHKNEMIPQQVRKTIDQIAWHDMDLATKKSIRIQVKSALKIDNFTDYQKATFDAELHDHHKRWGSIKKKKTKEHYFQLCVENNKKWTKTKKRHVADEEAGRAVEIDRHGCQICHTKKTGIAVRLSSRSRPWVCPECKGNTA
eukprot:scaffold15048_cov53-Cyclotella_meneghiniana.AAC.2